jgi:hypothetical protein
MIPRSSSNPWRFVGVLLGLLTAFTIVLSLTTGISGLQEKLILVLVVSVILTQTLIDHIRISTLSAEDRRMLDEAGKDSCFVVVQMEIDGVLIGEDRGILWAESKGQVFNGHETSFILRGGKFAHEPLCPSRWIRWFSSLGAGALRLPVDGKIYRLTITEVGRPFSPIPGYKKKLRLIKEMATQESVPNAPVQFPPLSVQPGFVDKRLLRTAVIAIASTGYASWMAYPLLRDWVQDGFSLFTLLAGGGSIWLVVTFWSASLASLRELAGRLYGVWGRRRLRKQQTGS